MWNRTHLLVGPQPSRVGRRHDSLSLAIPEWRRPLDRRLQQDKKHQHSPMPTPGPV
ncbi:hypothetical protein B0I35DRAFT_423902 [Stachybotrys elegans]|uniref:Uncharacterized protein n=1 Tax=Stachybotrys elegans TaxID=80388 RepID=A0A8K0WTM9_9HYPO|nr:hypothetical protein B0I35DRAFT_423902 [Stachybotrys elegans]